MAPKIDITADYVRSRLHYDPATGLFVWCKSRSHRVGKPAGWKKRDGYIYIRLDGRLWSAHRLAWLHHYGEHPRNTIDHINRDKTDNRIANLRDVSFLENMQNVAWPDRRQR